MSTSLHHRASVPQMRRLRLAVGAVVVACLVACGGGDSIGPAATELPSPAQASRFLAQATFGPSLEEVRRLERIGYSSWIDDQFAKPARSHRAYLEARAAAIGGMGLGVVENDLFESFWGQAVGGEDQLRQRVAFALSQIFVVSLVDPVLAELPIGVADYLDLLGREAFGNFRTLLESVSLHPMMGVYLSSLGNRKEDGTRVPDENFAREIMQLFTIGLYELNLDGSLKVDSAGAPIETYTSADVGGLARVFTGWSWYAGPSPADRTELRFDGRDPHPDRAWRAMQPYDAGTAINLYHSPSEKNFLGTSIPAGSPADTEADLRLALDRLFAHPNVGPFIGRQLIQRLVTSNPGPAYVQRVAEAFNDNGAGVRGDMKAVIRAVLLDPQARGAGPIDPHHGKLREPVLRLANFLRAFNSRSTSGRFLQIDNTDDPATRLGQTPLKAPSVFNYFRPGYTPAVDATTAEPLVAPEMQLVSQVSVAGYLNYLRTWVTSDPSRDIQQDFTTETGLAEDPERLIEHLELLLVGGDMSPALREQVVDAVESRGLPEPERNAAGAIVNLDQIEHSRRDRVAIAIYLTMASTEYLVQR